MALTEFLLARIAEDEVVARRAQKHYQHVFGIPHYFTANSDTSVAMNPRVAIAECEAKRQIVTDFKRWQLMSRGGDPAGLGTASGLRVACLRLAMVYADHPDFREEWQQ